MSAAGGLVLGDGPVAADRARGRLPGLFNMAAGLLVLLVIVPLALRASQPAPPQVAEFSPQANQIKDAPKEQAANAGKAGAGDSGGLNAVTGASPSPAGNGVVDNSGGKPDAARVKHCVGNPARQIEDPQSPPCVAYWAGDNGGATTRGVTGDTIRVAVPSGQDDATLLSFFNQRFQFYGRKLVFVPYTPTGGIYNQPGMLADANTVDTTLKVFADTGYVATNNGESQVFYDELARRKVLNVQSNCCDVMNGGDRHMEGLAPYQWNYQPSSDKILENYAEFVCRNLVGHPPQYAGPPQSQEAKRIFGVVRYSYADGSPQVDTSEYIRTVRACGGQVVGPVDWSSAHDATASMVLGFQQQGVSSVICLCHTSDLALSLMPGATSEGYFPEWMISNMIQQDDDYSAIYYPPNQAAHVIGLMSRNKTIPLSDQPYQWAGKEVDPNWSGAANISDFVYYNLLVLASGIQMAGPHLTAQTFQDALYRTHFANPGAAAPPYYQATVGFGPVNHTMVQDLAPVWWSTTDQSLVVNKPGTYCYIDQGKRFSAGDWPSGIVLQDHSRPCR